MSLDPDIPHVTFIYLLRDHLLKRGKRLPWTEKSQFCDAEASKEMSHLARRELEALHAVTEAGCSSTPKLLQYMHYRQNDKMCLPGGSLLYLLMEKLPGVSLEYRTYWKYDVETRNRIRRAFKETFTYEFLYHFVLFRISTPLAPANHELF